MAEDETDRQFATNLARGLEVLRAFEPGDATLGNGDLVRRTGLPKATVSRLCYTLATLGYLSVVPRSGRYRLGAGVLALGYPLLAALGVRQRARPHMERIAQETGCTVNLALRDGLEAVYVDTCRADAANPHWPDVGSTRPLMSSSIGRAILLGMDETERTALLNRLRVRDEGRFAADRPGFEREAARMAASGFASAFEAWRPGVFAVAVPLWHDDRLLAMSCSLGTPADAGAEFARHAQERLLAAAPLLIEAAAAIGEAG